MLLLFLIADSFERIEAFKPFSSGFDRIYVFRFWRIEFRYTAVGKQNILVGDIRFRGPHGLFRMSVQITDLDGLGLRHYRHRHKTHYEWY